MSELWHRMFASMTRGADMRGVLTKSLILAVLSTIFAVPYFRYLIFTIPLKGHLPINLGLKGFLVAELFLLFIICLLSSVVGFSFSKRLELPGFGDKSLFIRSIPLLLVLGAVMTVFSYFLFDRHFIELSPVSCPKDVLYLVSYPFKGAFTEEIILRFCLVTLGVGILKSKVAGVVLISVLQTKGHKYRCQLTCNAGEVLVRSRRDGLWLQRAGRWEETALPVMVQPVCS